MNPSDWIAVLAGLAAIAWVNWYFLFAARSASAATAAIPPGANEGHAADVTITVDGGYSPAAIRVRAGQPVRLIFHRVDTASCSDEVVFPDFGIRRFLPTGDRTTIEITPPAPGRYPFTCGMSMHRGVVEAE